jgi:hypothetical protein
VSGVPSCALVLLLFFMALRCNESDPVGPQAHVTIRNESLSWTVERVYIAASFESPGMGINRLLDPLPPGEEYTIEVEPDTYDVKIESDHPRSPLLVYSVEMADGSWHVGLVTEEWMEFTVE